MGGSSYLDICHGYINHILNNYGYQSFVFDGYDSPDSTKQAELKKKMLRAILIEGNMKTIISQTHFWPTARTKVD